MQKYSLLSIVKKHHNYDEYLHYYPNLLNILEQLNQKWATDISYIQTAQGTLYLSVIRDLFDNSIIACRTGIQQNINLVYSTIRSDKRKENVIAELQLHSTKAFNTLHTGILS